MNCSFFPLLLFITALSLDAFAASLVYGADQVRIPPISVAVLSGLSTAVLALFLFAGGILGGILPASVTQALCFFILLILGCLKLFDSTVKEMIRRRVLPRRVCFSVLRLNVILTVYADPSSANETDPSVLSPTEALSLGMALSLDSAAAGLGAGMTAAPWIPLLSLSLLFNTAAVLAGSRLGRRLAGVYGRRLSWLGGLLLLFLAFSKLF